MKFSPPVELDDTHLLDAFACGEPALDDWLRRRARSNQASGSSRTFVVTSGAQVAAYYCLSAGAVGRSEAPKSLQRNRPDPIPVAVIGRLAIDQRHQNQGLGTALLQDAMLRVLKASEQVGVAAILVHAISDNARRFYLSRGFLPSPIQEMTLCLSMETIRRAS